MTSPKNKQLLLTSTFINMPSKNTEFPKMFLLQCPLLPAFCMATEWCHPSAWKECAHTVVYACINIHTNTSQQESKSNKKISVSKGSSGMLLIHHYETSELKFAFPLHLRGFFKSKIITASLKVDLIF